MQKSISCTGLVSCDFLCFLAQASASCYGLWLGPGPGRWDWDERRDLHECFITTSDVVFWTWKATVVYIANICNWMLFLCSMAAGRLICNVKKGIVSLCWMLGWLEATTLPRHRNPNTCPEAFVENTFFDLSQTSAGNLTKSERGWRCMNCRFAGQKCKRAWCVDHDEICLADKCKGLRTSDMLLLLCCYMLLVFETVSRQGTQRYFVPPRSIHD